MQLLGAGQGQQVGPGEQQPLAPQPGTHDHLAGKVPTASSTRIGQPPGNPTGVMPPNSIPVSPTASS